MAKIEAVPRVFKLGPTLLEDPDPEASPEDALKLYVPSHPALAHCALSEPRLEADRLVYEVIRPTATTKGRGAESPKDAIEREISAWEAEWADEHDRLADKVAVNEAHQFLAGRLRARPIRTGHAPLMDPSLIPMC